MWHVRNERAILIVFAFATTTFARADVTTSLSGSTLVVTGDDMADAIQLESAADGVSLVGVDGTLVDGSSASITIPGVQRLTVKLGQGADRLTIRHLDLPKKLDVHAGRGNDRVVLDGVRAGWTHIVTNDGNDRVSITEASRFTRLVVDTGDGDDLVLLDTVRVSAGLDVITRAGDDDVEIVATDVGDDVDVELGDDDDDVVLADVVFHDDTDLDGGSGDDEAFFYGDVWIGDDLDLDGFGADGWWWFHV